jgi:serine/threonine protein kinase
MPPSAAVSAVLDIIGGLDAAQAAGILHRDIKPGLVQQVASNQNLGPVELSGCARVVLQHAT